MDQPPLDPGQLLADLREERRRMAWEPLPPAPLAEPWRQPRVAALDSLAYLHQHWALDSTGGEGSVDGQGGVRGRLVRVGRHLVTRLLSPDRIREQALRANVVQTVDALARRLDELTQRVEDLVEADAARQMAQARRLAQLAAWVHSAVPGEPAVDGARAPSCARTDGAGSGTAPGAVEPG